MSELADAATRVAILAALKAKVLEAYETARYDTADGMDAGDRKAARLGDSHLGHVVKAVGATRAKVIDQDAFTAWVAQRHPEEVTQAVRPSYEAKVLKDAKHHGAPVDTSTGEVIPGVEVDTGAPYVTVRLDDNAAEVITANWQVALRLVPELPGADIEPNREDQ